MHKKIYSLVMLALILFINGCSVFRSSTETVNVSCAQEGSTIMLNDARFQNVAHFAAQRDKPLVIRCYKEGYYPYSQTVNYHLNTTGVLDIVGTFLFLLPVIGLFTAGAFSLDTTDVNVQLFADKK